MPPARRALAARGSLATLFLCVEQVLSLAFTRRRLQTSEDGTAKTCLLGIRKLSNVEYKEETTTKRRQHPSSSYKFNLIVGILILINSLLVGIEMDRNMGDRLQDRMVFFILDLLFGVVFLVEMVIRTNLLGWDFFCDHWNILDFALVIINVSDLVNAITTEGTAGVKLASALRVLRLLRVARHIQDISMLKGMWMVVQGLMNSLKSLVWTGLFLLIIVYVIAVSLVTFTGQDFVLRERWEHADLYVGSVFSAMLTIVQVFTLDSWASQIVRPLIDAGSIEAPAILILAVVVCNFGIMNIIIALMVERLSRMTQERDNRNSKILKQVQDAILKSLSRDFLAYGLNPWGTFEKREFKNMLCDKTVIEKLSLLNIGVNEAAEIFDILDTDESGTVDAKEFRDCLGRIRGKARSADLLCLICLTKRQTLKARETVKRVRALSGQVDVMQYRLNCQGRFLTSELEDRKVFDSRKVEVVQDASERTACIQSLEKQTKIVFPTVLDDYYD